MPDITHATNNIGYSSSMPNNRDYRGGAGRDESVIEFTSRARRISADAASLSISLSDGYAELNRLMGIAKARGMTWMEGLYFSVDCMKGRQDSLG